MLWWGTVQALAVLCGKGVCACRGEPSQSLVPVSIEALAAGMWNNMARS